MASSQGLQVLGVLVGRPNFIFIGEALEEHLAHIGDFSQVEDPQMAAFGIA